MVRSHQIVFGRWMVLLTVFLLLLGSSSFSAQAGSSLPGVIPTPQPTSSANLPDTGGVQPGGTNGGQANTALGLPPLKAVLIVGPIDGDNGTATTNERNSMELAAIELEANGVQVFRFYPPNNNWDEIKAAANGAHFLMYRGHGIAWGALADNPPVGGFALTGRFISGDDIRRDIRLAPNAVVMLYGCFTAGSSSSDTRAISAAEAKRRVEQYSDPFFDVGAGGYFADWFGDAFQLYVRYLFQGMTQQQAYESYHDYSSGRMIRVTHADHPSMQLWMGWDEWYDPKPQYNNAFVGKPDRRLSDLFPAPAVKTNQTLLPVVNVKP